MTSYILRIRKVLYICANHTMKNNFILSLKSILFFTSILMIVSCAEEDIKSPELNIKGDSVQYIVLNAKLVDPGAKALDEVDGDISATIESDYLLNVNKDSVGTYIATYKIKDKAGNQKKRTRRVIVENSAKNWVGNYNVRDTLFEVNNNNDTLIRNYTATISASPYLNNLIIIKGFGKYVTPIELLTYVLPDDNTTAIFREQEFENLNYNTTLMCTIMSHRIKATQPFVLESGEFIVNYSDEIFEPLTCIPPGVLIGKARFKR
jgi:hypothetical protein